MTKLTRNKLNYVCTTKTQLKMLPKTKPKRKLKTGETFFDFKNPLRKQRSYDFHNVEEEEPHYSSPLDKSNSCVSQL